MDSERGRTTASPWDVTCKLGEEEDDDLQHLCAEGVEKKLREAFDDGEPREHGLGTGLPAEALNLEN